MYFQCYVINVLEVLNLFFKFNLPGNDIRLLFITQSSYMTCHTDFRHIMEITSAAAATDNILPVSISIAKFIVPFWGDKVDSGLGLSYRPARLHRLAGRYETLCQS
jgi:hypothetical protein